MGSASNMVRCVKSVTGNESRENCDVVRLLKQGDVKYAAQI
jgi:hypothetical protein